LVRKGLFTFEKNINKKEMKKFLIIIFSSFLILKGFSQAPLDKTKSYDVACVAFYNLENLYDTLDTENVSDSEFTPEGEKKWNTKKYYEKLDNMADVISQLGVDVTPEGAAILGVAEIENRMVLEDLAKTSKLKDRNYQIVHYDGPDRRGVDVALFYNPKYFKEESSRSITLTIEGKDNFKTRDQLLVTGYLMGERVHIMVAHWPSRRGGQKRSSPLREAAADLGRAIIDSIYTTEPNAKIIYMGDLNDDPNNVSVKKNLKTQAKLEKVEYPYLFNPMEELFNKGIGTLAWQDSWNLFDQIIITPDLAVGDYSSLRYYGVKVFNKPFVKQSSGKFQGYPFRTYGGPTYLGGYSDHFAVYIYLVREKK
jgi:hypothetical protein